jgi:hypothetical protein
MAAARLTAGLPDTAVLTARIAAFAAK